MCAVRERAGRPPGAARERGWVGGTACRVASPSRMLTLPSPLPSVPPTPRGADAAIKNAEGKAAGQVAEMNEQAAVVELLKAKA